MNTINRIFIVQPDYIFSIVRPEAGWSPRSAEDRPAGFEVVSQDFVASYEEARDDLLRTNQQAMAQGIGLWAVIQSAGTHI